MLDYENQMLYGIPYNISEAQYKFTCNTMQSRWFDFQVYGIKYKYKLYTINQIHFLHPIYLFLDHNHSRL